MSKVSVLFICMGNICRSPSAHGIFEQMSKQAGLGGDIYVDSAGTYAGHVGEKPDPRSIKKAEEAGFDISYVRSRKVVAADYEKFDYILAMDTENLNDLKARCPEEYHHKLALFMEAGDIAEEKGHVDVPDPYYGGDRGFVYVLDLVVEGSKNILETIKNKHC